MRKPRRRRPNQYLDITLRCHHSEMRLLPKAERVQAIGFWVGKALERFRGVKLLAICQMSNHLHLIILDRQGEASSFMQYAAGFMAKAINQIDDRHGAVFERRFSEITILDREALAARIAYIICNPIAAKLVRSFREWTGLIGFASAEDRTRTFRQLQHGPFNKAVAQAEARGGPLPDPEAFTETVTFRLAAIEPDLAGAITEAVDNEQARLQAEIPRFMGMKRALAQSPFDRPAKSKRSPMPICFASTVETWFAFVEGWRSFVRAFRTASELFRDGNLNVAFPEHCFRPAP